MSPYEEKTIRLAPSKALDLAFATIGLMRHVNSAAPLDLIDVYCTQTKQPWAFKYLAHVNNLDGWVAERATLDIRMSNRLDKTVSLPPGIVNMAKDYLTRSFWNKIKFLRNVTWEARPENKGIKGTIRLYPDSIDRLTFPRTVLNTLSGLRLSNYADLWDSRNAIEALHAVCTPVLTEKPDWLTSQGYDPRCKPGCSDTMKECHIRALETLDSILNNYCWKDANQKSIPNQAEKNLLLDLLESMIILRCGSSFASTFVKRQYYEYARLEDIYHLEVPGNSKFRIADFLNTNMTDVYVRIDSYVDSLKHLSPEAALCLDPCPSFNGCGSPVSLSESTLRRLKPQPLKEVSIYVKTDATLRRWKANQAKNIIEATDKEYACAPEDCCCADC